MSGKLWNQPDTDRLIALYKSGMTMVDIANTMGISVCKARGRLTRLGYVGGKNARRLAAVKKPRSEVGRSWDSKLFLPWPEYKLWRQEQRRMGNVEV